MKIICNFDGTFSLNGMNIDDLESFKRIIKTSSLVDKRNFYCVEKDIEQIIQNK